MHLKWKPGKCDEVACAQIAAAAAISMIYWMIIHLKELVTTHKLVAEVCCFY